MTDLFVYGTLLRGAPQGALLAHLPRTDARVAGRLFRMPAGYPALVLLPDDHPERGFVHGELVSGVDPRLLVLLDRYEGVDEGLYVRREADVLVGLLRRPALVYEGVQPARNGGVPIPSGRWTQAVRRGRV
ncbi:MAG: gamma-glutamylcyclotransferase [Alphaproteobacteria bacterium]|nr:gamma-glutamylcyclotransferase [Alphaproteobacteria bacterium]